MAHRRDEHPIGKRQISNRKRIKQASHVSSFLSHDTRHLSPIFRSEDAG